MAKKVVIPWELKCDFAMRGYASIVTGFLYAIREKYGAAATLEIYARALKIGDRIKNLVNTLLTIFKIEGNDAEAIREWWDIWHELTGMEVTWLERSKTIFRNKITKCPWKIERKDISDRCIIFCNLVNKTINSKATFELPKGMCVGDSYCESVTKIEE